MFTREARADRIGHFRICGLPANTPLFFRAVDGARESSAPTELSLSGTRVSANIALWLDEFEKEVPRLNTNVDSLPAPAPLTVTGARTVSLREYNAAAGRGTVVGVVTAKESGQPLPYADLFIEPFKAAAFTSSEGSFRLTQVPAGTIRIRARRVGSAPVTITVGVTQHQTDTVRIELQTLALALARVSVRDNVCPNRDAKSIDASIVTILQQVQLNAERGRLLARDFPFEMILERTVANEAYAPFSNASRIVVDTLQVDTISATMEHGWRYEPGKLIRSGRETGNEKIGAPERMVVPQLVDFAEPAFVAAHCFRYAGVVPTDGHRLLRVDFEPTKAIKEPDVRGSLYFDTLTYQIQRSTLYLDRPSPQKAGDTWHTRVDTWFREIVPSLPVFDRIAHRTTVSTVQRLGGSNALAATEYQRLLNVRFLDGNR
jgi:hypothetical protein